MLCACGTAPNDGCNIYREQLLEALLEASRHLLVPEMSQNRAVAIAREVAGSLLQVGIL